MLEVYQTFCANIALLLAAVTIGRLGQMSWQNIMKVGLAGLVCVFLTVQVSADRDVKRAEAPLGSRLVGDPACRTENQTVDGDTERWVVVCPKPPGRPL